MIDSATTLLATVQAANDGDEAALAFLQLAAPDLCKHVTIETDSHLRTCFAQ